MKRNKRWYEEYDDIMSAISDARMNNTEPLKKIHDKYFDLLQKKDTAHDRCIIIFRIGDYFDELKKPYERFIHQNTTYLLEKTVFWFESVEITLRRQYLKFGDTHTGIQSRLERDEKGNSSSIIIPKNQHYIDFREPNNDIIKRTVFVFYYNILQLSCDDWYRLNIAQSIWHDIKTKGKTLKEQEEMFDEEFKKYKSGFDKFNFFNNMDNQKYEISKKLDTASEKAKDIIVNDPVLKNMINEGIIEINAEINKLKDVKIQPNIK